MAELFSKMKSESARLESFKSKWTKSNIITPENLAKAGFFYLNKVDQVQCPFCYVIIHNWEPKDEKPLREHIRWSPKCPFLLGLNVGNIPLQRVLKVSPPPRLSLLSCKTSMKTNKMCLEQQLVINDTQLLCKICMDENINITFQPCGHCISCEKCSKKLFDCPICRRQITYKIFSIIC